MKTVKNIILGTIFVLALFSCESHVGLGTLLDLNGPDVNFTSPVPRKAVTANFILEGTAEDYSGVKMLLIKVEKDRIPLPRQWRYSNGGWEISDDSGTNWKPLTGGVWKGDKSVVWGIPVNMVINGIQPDDGEYMFSAQAWDNGGVTDDKSFKTLVLIIDKNPPKVTVFNPLLYSKYLNYNPTTDVFDDAELQELRTRGDWRDPELIGKFQTSSFTMQWSIEDNFNIWSFDLRFYEMSVPVDNIAQTPLPDNYIYRFHQNVPPAPDAPSAEEYLKPNGLVIVPALDGEVKDYGENGELKKSITDKTTIRVVGVCYDAANNVTEERTLGYLIYWRQADIPWITYTGDLQTPEYYDDIPSFSENVENAFLVYPGRKIKAIAFHTMGVKEVTFSLFKIDEPKFSLEESEVFLLQDYENIKRENPSRGNNNYSTSFSWEFEPPPRSAFYIVEAKVLSVSGKESEVTKALFKVQDITFPDFPDPIQPPALEPFYKFIETDEDTDVDYLEIHGIVSDATEIDSLCLVWINPQSKEFAAQRQLEYFRDAQYVGWLLALDQIPGGTYAEEYEYDASNPNKVWRLKPTLSTKYINSINPDSQRIEYDFSIKVPIEDLNIGIGKQHLKSQVFLLRASNPSPKTTVITYTPQGDESRPDINITKVEISNGEELKPGKFGEIPKFKNGDTITIMGTWKEDSVKYLDFDKYLKDTFIITINQTVIPNLTFTGNVSNSDNGTWKAVATVKDSGPFTANDVPLANLKDTMVVSATVTDIGGNVSDDGASWLIKSDMLRLVRISSELADQTYNAGKAIDIFIEFNKPVRLKNGGNPSITLNVTGGGTTTASYKNGQVNQNTRQYFTYNVLAGQSTTDTWLDVTGLSGLGTGSYWEAGNYPFIWTSTSGTGTEEEIRVTMNPTHSEGTEGTNGNYLMRRLPVKTITADLPYTLANGKNIGIDTTAPNVTGISSSNKAGHYALGSVIDINVKFSEPVKIKEEANPPQLTLQLSGKTVETSGTPKVNNEVVTFSYTVGSGDTTRDNKLIISSFAGGQITDIAGTDKAANTFDSTNGALNGGVNNDGAGIFVNTLPPGIPTFRALKSAANNDTITNTVGGTITGESEGAAKDLKNYYGDNLYFAIIANTTGGTNTIGGTNSVGYFEYTLDPLSVTDVKEMNWKRIDSSAAFRQDIYGKYIVRARQIDKAGNISSVSAPVSINWDPGTLVTRIDSSTPNGTYTNNTSRPSDTINITVYFRKTLTITGTPRITLNAIRGSGSTPVTVTTSNGSTAQLSFTYDVQNNDNTPAGKNLDVDAFSITATDSDNVTVTDFIKLPTDNDNKLAYRKDILVDTKPLTLSGTNPTYDISASGDEATGTITFTFNRNISKRSGEINIIQQTAGYRLPAVLTEEQANRYKSARYFNTYYSRGTNGFVGSAPDTSTKFILNYTDTTVVTPNNAGSAQEEQMAYDFLAAESVTLPVSSQDVTINNDKLVINLTGSNALQVLGATYNIDIPAGLVQDSLGFQSDAKLYNGTGGNAAYTAPGVNRPFVRVDKKINEDRITATGNGGTTRPHLNADFSNLIQTRARLDCRTPGSIVRYIANGAEHSATGADSTGSNPGSGANQNTNTWNWKNTANNADSLTNLNGVNQQNVTALGEDGTEYDSFSGDTTGEGNFTHITVGTAANGEAVQGYVWRISVRSRNGATNNSEQYEEIAFRTVLTYEIQNMNAGNLGQIIGSGDQLWIRGGDAIGSSSVPGFPINWQDDYGKLNTEKKRAGIRLLRFTNTNTPTNLSTGTTWRYITWEISVQTWHDVVLGRGEATGTAQNANDAWQYGPRQWAYQRGGWSALKNEYTLIPGKHRWVRITNQNYTNGVVNFSLQFSTRGTQAVTLP